MRWNEQTQSALQVPSGPPPPWFLLRGSKIKPNVNLIYGVCMNLIYAICFLSINNSSSTASAVNDVDVAEK